MEPGSRRLDSERVNRVDKNNLNVKEKYGRLDIRKKNFTVRASSKWNSVPAENNAGPLV